MIRWNLLLRPFYSVRLLEFFLSKVIHPSIDGSTDSDKQTLSIVDKLTLEKVLAEIKKAALMETFNESTLSAGEYFHVIDAFDVPKYKYKSSDKSFVR